MRQTLPALQYVQELEGGLAGDLGVSIDGCNATVPGDDGKYYMEAAEIMPADIEQSTTLSRPRYSSCHQWIPMDLHAGLTSSLEVRTSSAGTSLPRLM